MHTEKCVAILFYFIFLLLRQSYELAKCLIYSLGNLRFCSMVMVIFANLVFNLMM